MSKLKANLILGIETSCDETALALLDSQNKILANEVLSSLKLHAKTGGIVPEIAAREHVRALDLLLRKIWQKTQIPLAKVEAIAVSKGPGLASALLAGVTVANTLQAFTQKKLIPVNHIFGHVCSILLKRDAAKIQFPLLTLTVSGGHSDLIFWESWQEQPRIIGETLDDAAGEAFDKTARILALGYPGGPALEKFVAENQAREKIPSLPRAFLLPRSQVKNFAPEEVGVRIREHRLQLTNFNFSFAGLKSEVRRRSEQAEQPLTPGFRASLAAEFQRALCEVLATKLVLAAQKFQVREIHLVGGVSANHFLRQLIKKYARQLKVKFRVPRALSFCTDNAAMIAAAGNVILQREPQRKWNQLLEIEPSRRSRKLFY